MLNFKTTGRFLSVTALAASTALSAPLAALAQEAEQPPAQIQDAPPEVVAPAPEAPTPEAPAAPDVAPEPEAAPAPEPEAAPAPEPEPEAPAEDAAPPAAEPAPEPASPPEEPAAPRGEAPASETQSAPDTGAPVDAPEGNPSNLPADAGTQNDLGEAPAAETPRAPDPAPTGPAEAPAAPAAPEPSAEPTPATPPAAPGGQAAEPPAETSPSPVPPAPPAPGSEPVTPQATPADPAAPAAPSTPPTAPIDPAAPPVAPGAAPVVPGTPQPPAAPGAPAPIDPAAPAPMAPVPTAPAPGAPPAAGAPGADPQAAAAPPPPEAPRPVAADIQTAPVPQGQIDQSDARVQSLAQPVEVRPVTAVQGQRIERAPEAVLPPNVEVYERVGNRDILSIVGAGVAGAAAGGLAAYFIRSDDNERLSRGSRDVTYEELPRGLTRETIVRPNGVQIVTIENEFGDVIQRSRISPDGREDVLFYDPYAEDTQRPDYYSDAGADLPPIVLEIPEDRYIVDISEPDEELYYDTIVAPPVETVERIYSLDEVRRSPRIRDKVRRIDVNTITFGFGSATVEQAEVDNLQELANAVKRVIDDNPSEVFLLEGHTDAVGSNVANLALSDQRAEAVATALTEFFEIPSENIVTQGYGEEDLKVDTEAENRENRRVTLRRITPLVKPVVAAQAN